MRKGNAMFCMFLGFSVVLLVQGFAGSFPELLESFSQNNPEAVALELTWSSAQDSYQANLLAASSKLQVLEADLKRFQDLNLYQSKKWELIAEFLELLWEIKELDLEHTIADVSCKMYMEDFLNKQKAFQIGGVSQSEVDLAQVDLSLSETSLEYYDQRRETTREYVQAMLFLSDIPEVQVASFTLDPPEPALDAALLQKMVPLQIESLSQELENTKYQLSSAGIQTPYTADSSRKMAKIHELRKRALEDELLFQRNKAYQDLVFSRARFENASEKKSISLQSLSRLQEARTKGYITSKDYYKSLLDMYQFDRLALEAEKELLHAIVEYCQTLQLDPLETLPRFLQVVQ
ncbi:MAG TPA: hypothetical protein P5560_01570 [Thermotogota bacterium]|nr:hypothetical protein [Thermotogota bacterium]